MFVGFADGEGFGARDGVGVGKEVGEGLGAELGVMVGDNDGAGTGTSEGFRVATTASTSKEESTDASTPLCSKDARKLAPVVSVVPTLAARVSTSSAVDTISKLTSHWYASVSCRIPVPPAVPRRPLPSLRRSSWRVAVMTKLRITPRDDWRDDWSAAV